MAKQFLIKTPIGDIIRAKRVEKKLTQSDLAKIAGCDTSTISRIEKNQAVNTQLLETIFRFFEIDASLLNANESDVLKIGFGHCIWATPIINLLLNSKLNLVNYTSFGFNNNEPQFLNSDNVFVLPSLVNCFNGPDDDYFKNRGIFKWEDAESFKSFFNNNNKSEANIKSYDASDLLGLLKNDQLDCLVIPGDLYDDNVVFVEKAASIIYTAEGGCEFCVIYPEDHPQLNRYFSSTAHAGGSNILELLRQNMSSGVLNIFYSEDTIADKYLELYLMNDLQSFPNIEYKPVDIGNWQKFWTESIKPVLTKDKKHQNISLFLGWQPQTLWLQQSLHDEHTGFSLKQFEFRKLFKEDKLNYFSFDVLFNRKGKWRYKPITQDFFRHLNQSIRDLNTLIKKLSDTPLNEKDSNQLLKKYKEIVGCSKYLNMDMNTFLQSITKLNFDLKFYHDWTYPISAQII